MMKSRIQQQLTQIHLVLSGRTGLRSRLYGSEACSYPLCCPLLSSLSSPLYQVANISQSTYFQRTGGSSSRHQIGIQDHARGWDYVSLLFARTACFPNHCLFFAKLSRSPQPTITSLTLAFLYFPQPQSALGIHLWRHFQHVFILM